jgi:hypothetical protein
MIAIRIGDNAMTRELKGKIEEIESYEVLPFIKRTFIRSFSVRTDANGNFSKRKKYPGTDTFFDPDVDIYAKLVSPSGTTATGIFDIGSTDGDIDNPARRFRLKTGGRWSHIGEFEIEGNSDEYSIVVVKHGKTNPPRKNQTLKFKIKAVY